MLEALKHDLLQLGSPERAAFVLHFFKTGKGQYEEGDVFIGVSNPNARIIAKKYAQLSLADTEQLLQNYIHEFRFVALIILVNRFAKSRGVSRQTVVDCYLRNLEYVNKWDLVDCSCYKILGAHLINQDRNLLYELAANSHFWSQQIAIVSTFCFIRGNQFSDTLRLAEILLPHRHDLIHKAIGWMLREIGKRDELVLEEFLD